MPAPDIGSGGQPNLWYDIVPGSSTEVGDFLWEEGLNSDNSWPRGTRMILMYQTFVSVIQIALRPTRSLTCALNLCAPIAEMNRHLSDIKLSEYGQFGATIIEDLCSLRFQNWGEWWDLMYLVSITLTRNYKKRLFAGVPAKVSFIICDEHYSQPLFNKATLNTVYQIL